MFLLIVLSPGSKRAIFVCVEFELESVLEELALLQKREKVLIPGENIGFKDSYWVSYQHPLQAAHRF